MMAAQNFGAEQAGDGRRGIEQPAVDQAFKVDDADVFSFEVDRAD